MKMEQTECSETLAYKIQTPGNYPEENIQQILSDVLCKVHCHIKGGHLVTHNLFGQWMKYLGE